MYNMKQLKSYLIESTPAIIRAMEKRTASIQKTVDLIKELCNVETTVDELESIFNEFEDLQEVAKGKDWKPSKGYGGRKLGPDFSRSTGYAVCEKLLEFLKKCGLNDKPAGRGISMGLDFFGEKNSPSPGIKHERKWSGNAGFNIGDRYYYVFKSSERGFEGNNRPTSVSVLKKAAMAEFKTIFSSFDTFIAFVAEYNKTRK